MSSLSTGMMLALETVYFPIIFSGHLNSAADGEPTESLRKESLVATEVVPLEQLIECPMVSMGL